MLQADILNNQMLNRKQNRWVNIFIFDVKEIPCPTHVWMPKNLNNQPKKENESQNDNSIP